MLGKIWYHAEERGKDRRPRFDRVVVDCPPTGHALKFVDVARTVFSVAPGGMMGEETRKIMHTLQDPQRSCLHVVTGLEELMLKETVELIEQAERSATAPLGYLICNGIEEPIFEPGDVQALKDLQERLAEMPSGASQDAVQIAANRAHKELRQGQYLKKIKGVRSNMPTIMTPLLAQARLQTQELQELGQWVLQQTATERPAP